VCEAHLLYLDFDITYGGCLDFVLIVLRDLQDAFNPYDGLMVDAFCPQQHILRHGFTFSQHTLNGSDVLTEDQEEDVFAHRSGMVDPRFKDDSSTGVFTGKIGDPLRLPFCERGSMAIRA